MPFKSVGQALEASCVSSECRGLETGVKYVVTVWAWNRVGRYIDARSDGVTIDSIAPRAGIVQDGPVVGADIEWQTSNSTLSATWSGFADAHSGLVSMQVGVGLTVGGTEVVGYIDVSLATASWTFTNLSLSSGRRYYVTVRVVDLMGNAVSAGSNGINVDVSPPCIGIVEDGVVPGDATQQFSLDTIGAHWSRFVDAESGIAEYSWAIGSSQTSVDDLQPFVRVGLDTTAEQSGLQLQEGMTVYVSVIARNRVGLAVQAQSDGVTIVRDGLFKVFPPIRSTATSSGQCNTTGN